VTREILLSQLADIIASIDHSYPLRVAIDGIDAAGKTTLADELVPLLEQQARSVIRASQERADVVVENNDPIHPKLVFPSQAYPLDKSCI
jgi:pantothenate kinase